MTTPVYECQACGGALPTRRRCDRRFCSDACRQNEYRFRRRYGLRPSSSTRNAKSDAGAVRGVRS